MTEKEKNKNASLNKEVPDSSRRKFLRNTGIATSGVVGGAVLGGLLGNPFKTEETVTTATTPETHEQVNYTETRQFFLRQEDFDVLSAATEQIFPEDENGSGAIALGVPYFIDKQLAGSWGKNADKYMKTPFQEGDTPLNRGEIFIQGVRKLNTVSQAENSAAFKDLPKEQQIAILKAFESGEVEMNRVSSSQFFALLRQGTLEGAYADPMYGGNKNMEGWKMKEFPGAQMSYIDNVDKEEFVVIEPKSLGGHH